MTTHVCHAHGCATPHWFQVRTATRAAVLREYRPGQERDKHPSARYMAVQRRAVAEVAFRPRDEAAARISAQYLAESESWRALAISRGEGDPLAFCEKRGAK
jgi:hypothetical protein